MRSIDRWMSFPIVFFLTAVFLPAQTQASHPVTINIQSIAALAIVGGNITLTVDSPASGGDPPDPVRDRSCFLQYTSTVGIGQTRSVSAAWGLTDDAPAGCRLRLRAVPESGEGVSSGGIRVKETAQSIITEIGLCATGTGDSDGAQLRYTLRVNDVTSLVAGESRTVMVTFTLTDTS